MENLTTRQIAEKLGYTTEAVRQWRLSDYTPQAVAKELRARAGRKFLASASLSEDAQKMNAYANEIEQEATQ